MGLSTMGLVAATTDGAKNVRKAARLIGTREQKCFIQGLDFVVTKVMYGKKALDIEIRVALKEEPAEQVKADGEEEEETSEEETGTEENSEMNVEPEEESEEGDEQGAEEESGEEEKPERYEEGSADETIQAAADESVDASEEKTSRAFSVSTVVLGENTLDLKIPQFLSSYCAVKCALPKGIQNSWTRSRESPAGKSSTGER